MFATIRASPEFPIILFVFIVILIFLILRIVEVIDNRKKRKALEKLTRSLTEGEIDMSIFDEVMDEIGAIPVAGNEKLRRVIVTQMAKGAKTQATGLAEAVSLLSMVNASTKEADRVETIIRDVHDHIELAQKQYAEEAPMYQQSALGSSDDVGQQKDTISAPDLTQPEVQAESPVEVSTEVQVELPFETPTEVQSFCLEQARQVIRIIQPLKACITSHDLDVNSDFDVSTPRCLIGKLIDKLEVRKEMGVKPEKGESELLAFLLKFKA